MGAFLDRLYKSSISQRQKIITPFKIIYLFLIFCVLVAFMLFRNNESLLPLFYSIGKVSGELALVAYLLTLLPGMGGRFGVSMRILSILRVYRRYIGILMFILSLVHIAFVKIFFVVSLQDLLPYGTFEIMGMIAFPIFLILFLTSNNFSLGRFKIWWYRIQRFTYLGMFFLFFHVALVSLSIWTVLIGATTILQLISFFIIYKKTHSFH